MINRSFITTEFDTARRKKALLYTIMICVAILILFFLISWKHLPPSPPPLEQLIEVNLGNLEEGFGEVQPLIKGERGPSVEKQVQAKPVNAKADESDKINPDENADENAAPVTKPAKNPSPVKAEKTNSPAIIPVAKPQKPKVTYEGPGKGTGNNDTEDNGYKYQGNKPGGTGDAGDPNGNKDSYGNTPGGSVGGGPRVKGNRKIIRHYAFTGDLKKATIYAIVRVSPNGTGTFISFDKGSTSRASEYAQAIASYLRNIQFDRSTQESTVQVQFNFSEN
ncbi:MAG: hypothetical protein WKF35_07985 [Ferruginibacter sp.]